MQTKSKRPELKNPSSAIQKLLKKQSAARSAAKAQAAQSERKQTSAEGGTIHQKSTPLPRSSACKLTASPALEKLRPEAGHYIPPQDETAANRNASDMRTDGRLVLGGDAAVLPQMGTLEMFPELVKAAPDRKTKKQELLSEIRTLRKRGWTAIALAKRIAVPVRSLERWCLGNILPPCWVCEKLLVDVHEMSWENPPTKKTVRTDYNEL